MKTKLAPCLAALWLLGPAALPAEDPLLPPEVPAKYAAPWTLHFPDVLFFTDLHAYYPLHYYRTDPKREMVIHGEFPHCRYFSIVAYDQDHWPVASLLDQAIEPDPGSINPFRPGADFNAPNRRYTITVRFTDPPAGEGGEVFIGSQGARGNVLYVGKKADGSPNPAGMVAFRLYLPSRGYDRHEVTDRTAVYFRRLADGSPVKPLSPAQEKIKFRQLSLRSAGDFSENMGRGAPLTEAELNAAHPGGDLIWRRTGEVLGENPNTVYMYAPLEADPKKVLLLRFKVPTFPGTYDGRGIVGNEELRYGSLSFGDRYTRTQRTVADAEFVIGADGWAKILIGFGASRPAAATAENGYTWVDLKGKKAAVMIYRNMVPSPDFRYVARDLAHGAVLDDRLGDYLPKGQYLDPKEIQP